MTQTHLILVRHGETLWNLEGRRQGQADSPLTPLGIAQAQAIAGRLADEPVDALYSSDLTARVGHGRACRRGVRPAGDRRFQAAREELRRANADNRSSAASSSSDRPSQAVDGKRVG